MIRLVFAILLSLTATASLAQPASEAELVAFGKELRDIILSNDVEGLKRYMKHGFTTPNDHFTGREAQRKLDDKESWLYRRFFVGISSAKAFLQKHDNVTVDISWSCDYHVISYISSDGIEYDCPVLVYKKGKKIFIGELPPCPAP